VFPAKFGDFLAAMAQNLDVHLVTLDPADQTTQPERSAYLKLARESRRVADELRALAAEMASYRDLPMGRHDPAALSSPPIVKAFASFVKLERELLAFDRTRGADARPGTDVNARVLPTRAAFGCSRRGRSAQVC